jgi:hypothetical protein
MTSSAHARASALRELAEQAIPSTFDDWATIRARLERRRTSSRYWRIASAAVAAVVVTSIGVSLAVTSGTAPVSAEALLERANVVDEAQIQPGRNLHLTAVTTTRSPRGGSVQAGQRDELWVAADGRIRQETRWDDGATSVISDGRQAWLQVNWQGQTLAAPTQPKLANLDSLSPVAAEGSSIASVLADVRRRGCGVAELRGEDTVAGRPTHVVAVTHTFAEYCGDGLQPRNDKAIEDAGAAGERPALTAAEAAKLAERQRIMQTIVVDTFWIDKATYIVLKVQFEGNPKGERVYEVTSITYDANIPDSTFRYTPAAGTRVVAGPDELKQLLAPSDPGPGKKQP